jgi:hypothetical protein
MKASVRQIKSSFHFSVLKVRFIAVQMFRAVPNIALSATHVAAT